ncbi:MAG: outer membrane protein assembly factor BamA [Rhizobiaceae bacterium]
MKAIRKIMGAASAVGLSTGLIVTGTAALQFAAVTIAEAAVVSRIEVRGNKRIEAQTIAGYVGIKPGKSFSADDIDAAVKRLFATGLFADVRINQSGSALIVEVDEYAVVNQVLFQGNKKIKDDALAGAIQLKPRGVFSQATLDADLEAVRASYTRIGRSDAVISTQVIELGDGRVNVVFEINEGGRTKIGQVNFVGNSAYGDRRLAEVISTKRSSILSWLKRDDVYDEERLRADEEALRRFYYNHGYADFRVISSSAELDDNSNVYSITVTVEEGERYKFGPIGVESTVEGVDASVLDSVIETREGNVYSAKDVEDSLIAITEQVSGKGFAFAQVTPRGDRNFETRTISVTYTIDQGPRTYIERIEIRGNDHTRDYVIRREFDVSEGDAFNQVLIQRAKRRLEALDFFTAVNIATAPGSEADQVILVVDVVEKSTGEFGVGAGYSTGQTATAAKGVNVEASVSEKNFLGRGQFIKISVGGGKNSRDYTLSFTEPYFLGRRISAGVDLTQSTRTETNYASVTKGGTVRFAAPITNALSANFAYNLSQETYTYNTTCDPNQDGNPADGTCTIATAVQNGVAASPWIKSSVTLGLGYNTIDNMQNPRSGLFTNATTEIAGLGGDAKFVKFSARGTYYKTISEEMDIVGVLAGGAGHMQGFGAGGYRIFDMFNSNDRIIRGFKYNGIGPYDSTTLEHLGGTTYFNASAEAQFPMPGLPESFGLRGAVFADAATLFGNSLADAGTAMALRASVGASIIWASPFGPLRLDYAVPVLKQAGDVQQRFNFGVSTRF